MKKVLLFALLLAGLTASAQEEKFDKERILNYLDSLGRVGFYEDKMVVDVENTKANELFGRAMEALSDWTGENGRSSVGLDYHDKESGTIIYKGRLWLGDIKRANVYGNFTLKVRCKDDKAQITIKIASVYYNIMNMREMTYSITQLCEELKSVVKKKKKIERKHNIMNIKDASRMVILAMEEKLKTPPGDDF